MQDETKRPILFRLGLEALDADLDRLVPAPPGREGTRPGFNVESLMHIYFDGGWAKPQPHFGRLTTALHHLGYWLFVHYGEPIVEHPPGFWPKCVAVVDLFAEPEPGTPRGAFAVSAGGPSIVIPVPRVPDDILPGAFPSFERSRAALIDYCRESVERVNLVAPAALAIGGNHSA